MTSKRHSVSFYLWIFILTLRCVVSENNTPNVVVIMTDEHNLRTIGAYRDLMSHEQAFPWGDNVFVETPNIDRIAKEGALFNNFYAVTPLCTPSRASFMTGLYPRQTGAWKNHGKLRMKKKTFAHVLEDSHQTMYAGKWHLNGLTKGNTGDFNKDPNRKFGFKNTNFQYNRGHWKYFVQVDFDVLAYEWFERDQFIENEDEHYATDFLFDRAINFMETKHSNGKNFAVMLSIADPHAPNEVRPPYDNMFNDMTFQLPETGKKAMRLDPALPEWAHVPTFTPEKSEENIAAWKDNTSMQRAMRNVLGMIKLIDDNVGRLLQFITDNNLEEDTIVVFTSDHGDMMGEHGRFNKGVPYKASAQVPMMMRWPGKIPPGRIVNTAYTSVDFVPTLLGMMDINGEDYGIKSHGIDGSEEIMNTNEELISSKPDQIRFLTDAKMRRWAVAFTERYKLVFSRDTPWLYDMDRDPDELINYYTDPEYSEVAFALKTALSKAMKDYNFPLRAKSYLADEPICWDSKDEIPDWDNMLCTDLLNPQYSPACQWDFVKNHCPVICQECCEDSEGEVWLFGGMRTCDQMHTDERFCQEKLGQQFCPSSCGLCTS